uniref:Uncharacterized protein n=1 Tax=Arundo donax TaxID=35708 RepID=A0A0A9A8B4_ARUDO
MLGVASCSKRNTYYAPI